MAITEISIRLNKLEYDGRGNVTTSPQNIEEIFTSIPAAAKENMKTMVVHNTTSNIIYFGSDDTVTTANAGGVIDGKETREFPIMNLELSPYFIAGETDAIGLEIWS
jgi:hypothetical protein